ncbi:hypothetical protein [Ferrimonas balearica]|uniref:hypothetical protein n=1 Tax=Ferrimonas balearica TaxID=44012 RepID=UPI001C9968F4|nr:hypothetical protein [Ferrimonas balearica]MBY5991821.1 hypothetical protein [Ferrimonas balearica]
MYWRILLVALAYLLLGAHFLRFGALYPAVALALSPLLMLTRQAWAVRALQLGLVTGAVLVWLPTAYEFVAMRMAHGAPWLRLAAIMSAVTGFTLLSAYCLTPWANRYQEKA